MAVWFIFQKGESNEKKLSGVFGLICMMLLCESALAGTKVSSITLPNGTVIHTDPGDTVTTTQNGTVIVSPPGNGSNGPTINNVTVTQGPSLINGNNITVTNGNGNASQTGGVAPAQNSPNSNNFSNSNNNSGTGNGSTASPSITIPVPNSPVPPSLTSPTVVHHRG